MTARHFSNVLVRKIIEVESLVAGRRKSPALQQKQGVTVRACLNLSVWEAEQEASLGYMILFQSFTQENVFFFLKIS